MTMFGASLLSTSISADAGLPTQYWHGKPRLLDVRFGSLADIRGMIQDVCFTPKSRHVQRRTACPLSANSGPMVANDWCPPSAISVTRFPLLRSYSARRPWRGGYEIVLFRKSLTAKNPNWVNQKPN